MTADSNLPARRPRHDGWTAERQVAFLQALAACGCVTHAANAVGMSRQSAHNLYNRPSAAAFRRGWEAALDCSLRLLEDGIFSRAINGVARPVFYQGEQVGEYRHFDDRLAMFLLRHRRPHRYAALLKLSPPVPPPDCEDEGPDPDEPIEALDFHLGDLEDEAAFSGGPATIDGVNFVNLTPEPTGIEAPSGEGIA